MLKGFLATLGGLAAIGLVIVLFLLGGAWWVNRSVAPGSEYAKTQAALTIVAYDTALRQLLVKLSATKSYQERVQFRPAYDEIYKDWERDRESCAKELPHEDIYKVDEILSKLGELTQP
ncbi:hypothetical protein EBZ39_18750 [bacterium]|nr:hypothetical protein [bacterium]